MKLWARYACRSILTTWSIHFCVIAFLAWCVDLGIHVSSPLVIFQSSPTQERILLMVMLIFPLSLFSCFFTIVQKWRQQGELDLISYLNISTRTLLMPSLLACCYIFTLWIGLREFAWPTLHRYSPELVSKNISPQRWKVDDDLLIFEPQEQKTNRGQLFFLSQQRWFGPMSVYWNDFEWVIVQQKDIPIATTDEALHQFARRVLDPQHVDQFNRNTHIYSIIQIFDQTNAYVKLALLQRIALFFWGWIFFNGFWIYTLKNAQYLGKVTFWGFVIFSGISLCIEILGTELINYFC